ncbi:hypothetical protein BDV11DRAFT_212768 [Aspergillus similis]
MSAMTYLNDICKLTSREGHFHRKPSTSRNSIYDAADAEFLPESGRYYLYLSLACPYAHRVNIVHTLKVLESVIFLVLIDHDMGLEGWHFSGRDGTRDAGPLYGYKRLRDLHFHADPEYTGCFTMPMLCDIKKEAVGNNKAESAYPLGSYYQFDPNLRTQVDGGNKGVQEDVNNGIYKTGSSSREAAYDENVTKLFAALDRIESHLEQPNHPNLFGQAITDPKIWQITTMIRFDIAHFYGLSYNPRCLATSLRNQVHKGDIIVPAGPVPGILPLPNDADV